MKTAVVHYSEIGIKGDNREKFEKKLVDNMKVSLKGLGIERVKRLYGRVVVETGENSDLKKIGERLKKIPGIVNFSFADDVPVDLDDIRKALEKLAEEKEIKTFAVRCRRSVKQFKHNSRQVNEMMGEFLARKFNWKVDLEKPDCTFFIEITEKSAFVYTDKMRGVGGLPVTSSGKLVSLISGGIDSPVASWMMMRRGCSIVFIHFHNWSREKEVVKDKVESIVKMLSAYQPETKLYMVPFEEIQKKITMAIPADHRMIVYRRVMLDIGNRICEKENALGFVTGDSVGQVASQTLENLSAISKKAAFPIFSPLIGTDKLEIIDMAKRIGTYDVSILPYSDCCSFLVSEHPQTKARLDDVESMEKNLDIGELIKQAVENAEVKHFSI